MSFYTSNAGNSKGKGNEETNYHLELLKSKPPASPGLHVVLESLALHNGAKRSRCWAWEDLHSLLLASCSQNMERRWFLIESKWKNNK
jgi:hypothetical protein